MLQDKWKFHTIEGLDDRGEGDLGISHKLLGELQFHFFREYVVPAAKRTGADMLEFAAPEIGEVISGRKSFKSDAKIVGKQTLKNSLVAVVNGGESFQQNY